MVALLPLFEYLPMPTVAALLFQVAVNLVDGNSTACVNPSVPETVVCVLLLITLRCARALLSSLPRCAVPVLKLFWQRDRLAFYLTLLVAVICVYVDPTVSSTRMQPSPLQCTA